MADDKYLRVGGFGSRGTGKNWYLLQRAKAFCLANPGKTTMIVGLHEDIFVTYNPSSRALETRKKEHPETKDLR